MGTAEQYKAVVQGSLAYFGTFSIHAEEQGVTFHILGATLPNWIETTQERGISMSSRDRLSLSNVHGSGGGSALIVWRRKAS
ncbi:lipocalin-like domain-containing protein [Burkholderia sp. PAMC 26561]|uniref:lipocalin-like domain-containing protein n=1 Tax=Burkholderia sp. PAMC 26561 TaxID=1795043 RepID=UPI00076B7333|nr:hypothetical protein AXG89_41710 [Burkholderia sp. PAMC 26561]